MADGDSLRQPFCVSGLDFSACAWYRMVPFRELRVWRVEQPAVSCGIAGVFLSHPVILLCFNRVKNGVFWNNSQIPKGCHETGYKRAKIVFREMVWEFGNYSEERELSICI